MLNLGALGPVYGPLDNSGLPILGIPILQDFVYGQVTPERWPDQVIRPSPYNVSKIHLCGGSIDITGNEVPNSRLPGMWDYNDVKAVMALVYGEGSGPILPSFDFNGLDRIPAPFSYKKAWKPSWLGATAFGKTLFCCHYWIQNLVVSPEIFQLASHDECLKEDYFYASQALIENITKIKNQFGLDNSNRVLLRPAHWSMPIEEQQVLDPINTNDYLLQIHDFRMEALILNQKQNGSYEPNQGASVELNKHYPMIEYLLPAFSRLACISALYMGVKSLRDKKYQFSQQIQEVIRADYQELIRRHIPDKDIFI